MRPGHRPDCSCCLFFTGEETAEPLVTPTAPVLCDLCSIPLEIGMWPGEMCGGDPAYHTRYKQHIFSPVVVDIDGKKVTISSMQDADRITRESERRAANGEGSLTVFRAFHNEPSNQDRNSLGENPTPQFSTRNRRGLPYIIRKGDQGR